MFNMAQYFGTEAQANEHYSLKRFGDLWYHIMVGKEVNGVCPVYLFL